jgi:isomerase DpgB
VNLAHISLGVEADADVGPARTRSAQLVGVGAAVPPDHYSQGELLALRVIDAVTDDVARALADAAKLTDGRAGTEVAIRRQLLTDAPPSSYDDALGAHLAACDRSLRRAAADRAP